MAVGLGIAALALTVVEDQASVVLVLAVAVYAGAAAIAAQFPVTGLGPDAGETGPLVATTLAAIASGSAHLREPRPAARALVRMGGFRFLFGAWTLWAFVTAVEEDRTAGFDTVSAAGLAAAGTALGYVLYVAGAFALVLLPV